jgi:preprotein translocase subunit SecY
MKKFIEALKNCWKIEDLRQRLLITLLFVAIYRFGSFVVLPGIDPGLLSHLQKTNKWRLDVAGWTCSLVAHFPTRRFSLLESCLTSLRLL